MKQKNVYLYDEFQNAICLMLGYSEHQTNSGTDYEILHSVHLEDLELPKKYLKDYLKFLPYAFLSVEQAEQLA